MISISGKTDNLTSKPNPLYSNKLFKSIFLLPCIYYGIVNVKLIKVP